MKELLRPSLTRAGRMLSLATTFSEEHPAQNAFLSPIGMLRMFREYFFELGTFLGPPVGYVWISPGGTVELVETNSRRRLVELMTESSIETTTKSETDQTDKDELLEAVRDENASDIKLGASATASGGVGAVFQASGTASFSMSESRKQAREQTYKKMREQSTKLSREVR
jgi:hypothetical protein